MKKILLLVITALLAVSTSMSLEPMKVGFVYTGPAPVTVHVQLADNTNSAIFTGEDYLNVSPNNSGVIVVDVRDHAGSAGAWAAVNASSVTTYHTLDIYIGTTLYAQYRLDALILAQAQNGILDQDGNLTPPENGSGSLGTDELRWSELFVEGNTVHIGPALGMGAGELAFSYDDGTNTATMTVAGTTALTSVNDNINIPQQATIDGLTVGQGGGNKATNTASGAGALQSNTTGSYNTASGAHALINNTEGSDNTASGTHALSNNTEGSNNTASGAHALSNNTEGSNNTATGTHALSNNTKGINNTATGVNALLNNTDGNHNTAYGSKAGEYYVNGSNSVFIGYNAGGASPQKTNAMNSIAIGANTFTTANNQVVIGNSSITETNLQGLVKISGGADVTGNIKLGNNNDLVMEGQSGILFNTNAPIRIEDDLAVGVSGGADDKFYVSLNTGNTRIDGDVTLTNMAGSGTQNIQVDNTGKLVASTVLTAGKLIDISAGNVISKQNNLQVVTMGANVTIDADDNPEGIFRFDMTANNTFTVTGFTNPVDGGVYTFHFLGATNGTVNLPASFVKEDGTTAVTPISVTAGRLMTFYHYQGTNYTLEQ